MNTPLIEVAGGASSDPDASTAGRMATQEALARLETHAPSLVIVHAASTMSPVALLRAIRASIGIDDLPLIGGSMAGGCHDGPPAFSVQVTLLASPHLRAHVGAACNAAGDWKSAVDTALGARGVSPFFSGHPAHWRELTQRGSHVFGLVYSPASTRGTHLHNARILETLSSRSQGKIPFVGCTTANGRNRATNVAFANGDVIEGGLAVAVVETELHTGVGLSHGCRTTPHEVIVTASDGHEVITLNDRPALDVFAEYSGHNVQALADQPLTRTTGHGLGHAGLLGRYAFNTAGYATDRGGIELAHRVVCGDRLRLLASQGDDAHADTATDALRMALLRAHNTRPAAILMWRHGMPSQPAPADAIDTAQDPPLKRLEDVPLIDSVSDGQYGVTEDGINTYDEGAVALLLIGQALTPSALVARENEALRAELTAHGAVLERARQELEKQVARRTADLKSANERLRAELLERNRYQDAMIAQARLEVQEATLREHLQIQERLFDAIPVPVFHKDTFGRYTGCNGAFAEFLGRDKHEILGRTVFEIAPGNLAKNYRDRDLDLLDDPAGTQVYESSVEQAGGAMRHVVFHKARVTNAEGQAVGIIGTILDITESKAAAVAREDALAEAQRLAQVRKDFLANMSHEIRSPLNVVLGLAQAGRRQSAGRKAQAHFDRILGAGQMLLALVNDILDFSKIEANRLTLEAVPCELGQIIDQAVTVVARRAAEKGLDLQVEEAPDLPHGCTGDPLRLAQVLVNLLFNAVKFTERGTVKLSAGRDGEMLVLSVEDTGIGMSEEQQSRLFSAFEQAEASTTRSFGGTGLGLAITKRLVELMRGQIGVTSAPGVGSRFDVRVPLVDPVPAPPVTGRVSLVGMSDTARLALGTVLQAGGLQIVPLFADGTDTSGSIVLADVGAYHHPLTQEAQAAGLRVALVCAPGADDLPEGWRDGFVERPVRPRHVIDLLKQPGERHHAPPATGARLSGIRILAAEDAETNRIVLDELLSDEGARLTFVDTGLAAIDALERLGETHFDIVLTDIQMPGIDGYETARRIRALAPGLPVIGLTAYAMPEERSRCLATGMADHVTKPIELDTLVAAILAQVSPTDDAIARPTPSAAMAAALHVDDSPVDWPALHARFPNKPAVIARLAQSFVHHHVDTHARLQQAIDAHDLAAVARLAHALKGTAGHLCAHPLHDIADHACNSARAANQDAFPLARQLIRTLDATLAEAMSHRADRR